MKFSPRSLSAALLATTTLAAPGLAFAQDVPATDPQEDVVDEIVVVGRFIPTPMRQTSEIAAYVTDEDLERTGDSTAADALTRVAGLSVVEGRFIYVRGLGERYSSARLNNSPLPSPEPLQRVVPLDLFPASILGGLEVQKTYSADQPGEFGGGVINLRTIITPAEPFFTMSLGVGGDSETTLQEGLIYYGSRTDFTGFDDGTRDMPNELREAIATGNRVVVGADFTAADIQRIGWDFVNAPLNLLQRQEYIPADFEIDLAGGTAWSTRFGNLGVIGVLGYSNSWETRDGRQGEARLDAGNLIASADYDFSSTDNNVGWDGLFGLSLENGDHVIQWTNLWIRRTTKEARSRAGVDFDAPGTGEVRDDFTAWYVRELLNTQLSGDHTFGQWDLGWRTAYAVTSREAPYEKFIRYSIDATGVPFHEGQRNTTQFSDLEDTIASAGFDVSYTLPLSDERDAVFSFGAETYENDRSSENRVFSFQFSGADDDFQRQRIDYLFADFNQGPGFVQLVETTGGSGAAAYEANLAVDAAYAEVDVAIIPRVRTSVGIRYETAEQSVTTFDLFGGAAPFSETRLENEYWLPAATVTWNFAEDFQLRLGASRTIGRPQFRELAPQQYLDPDSDRLFFGNPYLTDTELTNLDARVEWYFGRNQFLTGGVFYKDLENPVESAINEAGNQLQQTYINAPAATLYGFELDFRRYFDSPVSGEFFENKRWFVQANYTYTSAELRVETGDMVFPLSGGGVSQPATNFFRDGDRLQGQSEHLANLQFGWEDDIAQSQATLLVTYVSERASARGRPGEPDIIQDPGVMLDFVWRRGFESMGRPFTFGLEARNLLGEDYEEYQEQSGRVDILQYDLGRSLSLSLSTEF